MKATKFPVTYRGIQYRVSVKKFEEYLTERPFHRVKIYVQRSGAWSRLFPFKRVYSAGIAAFPTNENDVRNSAITAIKRYVTKLGEREIAAKRDAEARATEAKAWRKFSEWDGNIYDEGGDAE